MKIVIPLDDGWKAPSSPETVSDVRSRLEAYQPVAKSPEALIKAAEKASSLRELHIDAVRMRAQREVQRAAEAAQRKLKIEAAQKQRLKTKMESKMAAAEEKRELSVQVSADRLARRAAAREAFEVTRTRLEIAARARAAEKENRATEAAKQREKVIKATVAKSAYQVKHALAVVAATKEKEREAATMAALELGT